MTKESIRNSTAQSCKSIRIPVTWDSHIGSAPNYVVDPAYINRVKEVTQWALDANLYVLIKVHRDSWVRLSKTENNHDQTLARYNALRTQIANAFKTARIK